MFKKILAFVCGVVPVGAFAAVENIANENTSTVAVADTEIKAVQSGNALQIYGNGLTDDLALGVAGDMRVFFEPASQQAGGTLFISNSVSDTFSLQVDGDVEIGGDLTVGDVDNAANRKFNISNYTDGKTFDVSIGGTIKNFAQLDIVDVKDFTSGVIDAFGDLSIDAANIETGAVTANGNTTTLDAKGNLNIGGLLGNQGGSVSLTGADVTVANVQNLSDGEMDISASNSITVSGVLENKGTALDINASGADIIVGTMTNESGSMTINAGSLSVTGGAETDSSFVNNADVYIDVSGAVSFANGINLNMTEGAWGNVFSLSAGSLSLGSGDTTAFFSNDLNDYNVVVGSAFTTGNVSNGLNNSAADMYLAAAGLTVQEVSNNAGTMELVGTGTSDLTVASVIDKSGATTQLSAGGKVSVINSVTANGNMSLRGQQVTVGSIVGNSGVLSVAGSTGETGLVTVNGNVSNVASDMTIYGRQINIVGNIANSTGNLTVGGSDLNGSAIRLGGVSISGGVTNLNGLLGIDIAQTNVDENTFGTGSLSVTNGVLNFGTGTHSVAVAGPADNNGYVVDIAGNILTSGEAGISGDGDVYVLASGDQGFTLNANGMIRVGGSVLATSDTEVARTLRFVVDSANIIGDVTATGDLNKIVFQGASSDSVVETTDLTVGGDLLASDDGVIEIHSTNISAKSLTEDNGAIYIYGDGTNSAEMEVAAGGVLIQNGITFNQATTAVQGLIIGTTPEFKLISEGEEKDISISGGIDLGLSSNLTLNSAQDVIVSGIVSSGGQLSINAARNASFANDVTIGGGLIVDATTIDIKDVTNNGSLTLTAGQNVNVGILSNSETSSGLTVEAGGVVYATAIESEAGISEINAQALDVTNGLDITGGTFTLNLSNGAVFGGNINVDGVLNQGLNKTGMLNLIADQVTFTANNLTTGGFVADSNFVTYDIAEAVTINGNVNVASGATTHIQTKIFDNAEDEYTFSNSGAFKLTASDSVLFSDVINSGALFVTAENGITMAAVQNSGILNLNSGNALVYMDSLELNGGTIALGGTGWSLGSELTTTGNLCQNNTDALSANDIGINADDYVITASNVTVNNINQISGTMNILSSDVTVNGTIDVSDLTIAANPDTDWLDMYVGGSILGGTKIYNLGQMTVGADYIFDKESQLLVGVSDYSGAVGGYWSEVNLEEGDNFGKITNAQDGTAEALIQVGGKLTSGIKYDSNLALNSTLADGQIGLRFQDVSNISAETAIWLLQAEKGLAEFSNLEKIRNLNVLFCNAGNTMCVLLNEDNLGAYISVRDALNNDGVSDSLYVVFDPRFGGPVLIENNRIQPIVARQSEHSDGEYVAAGALDNLITGQLLNAGFFNKSPIEVIPAIFENTNVETLMTELYNRMEYYVETADGSVFLPFSRLVQPREIEQIAGAIAMNEHTSFRNFEDRMVDEFIWNRNRNLKKAWADFDFGMFSQNVADDKRVYGNRFEFSGGFDWQESNTLILGLTGRVSHMSSDNSDDMDLGYIPGQSVNGSMSVDVADTNIGLGAYLMKTLGQKFRTYGNAFVDLHLIDTKRNQTFVDTIDGFGTALALTTEWGLMHDWLNQYIVGNLYARAGYNFGFSVTEKAAGENYMDLESDGYFMLTPGYSLTAQKRIYPSAWFQIRPYATIGVEYDVLGAPDYAKYKFASADSFSEYDIQIDALWANIGGGFEFLSATGGQIGIDYRYQYNNDMQLHNIKLSGSYRF